MPINYEEVLAAAERLRADDKVAKLWDSPYAARATPTVTMSNLRAEDEALLAAWAMETLFRDSPEQVAEKKQQVRCFVCDVELGYLDEVYPAVVAEVTGNYGSTVFDPMPTDAGNSLHLHICDMCFCEKAQYLIGTKAAREMMSTRVSLSFETVTSLPEPVRARYQKHIAWAENNL